MPGAPSGAVPLYMRLAEQIIKDAQRAGGEASGLRRIPAERVLATSLGVTRQTLRRALEHLRARGLVHTDRSGTYTYTGCGAPTRPVAGPRPQPLFPVGGTFEGLAVRSRARLSYEPVPPPVEALLGLSPERPTLVHRHELTLLCGETVQESVSYFSPTALAQVPRLGRRMRRVRGRAAPSEPDLRHLYLWMAESGLHPVRRDRVRVDRSGCERMWLAVRQFVHDQFDRPLEVTDLRIDPGRGQLDYAFALPS
ncbi:GntR family transcriptional regulator [Streptomyces sp. Je 1-79]|uniref:GntR family transcriptional regulator n=1 Tax=Streptomyces sp. Je 1-79 TaxID=2943847 RepID=UPI0021A2F252|nr:GntR family transcriptional regulator [Streptomyces sp. Je 1-79]MCT4351801.1 GntR family transcriptional regulator [Streptomyces sp. Je 1-79]